MKQKCCFCAPTKLSCGFFKVSFTSLPWLGGYAEIFFRVNAIMNNNYRTRCSFSPVVRSPCASWLACHEQTAGSSCSLAVRRWGVGIARLHRLASHSCWELRLHFSAPLSIVTCRHQASFSPTPSIVNAVNHIEVCCHAAGLFLFFLPAWSDSNCDFTKCSHASSSKRLWM